MLPTTKKPVEALARTAVATAETRTDNIWWQAFTHDDLATVLERAGRIDEARAALERSLTIWERKGCLPCAQRVRDQVASLGQETVSSEWPKNRLCASPFFAYCVSGTTPRR